MAGDYDKQRLIQWLRAEMAQIASTLRRDQAEAVRCKLGP